MEVLQFALFSSYLDSVLTYLNRLNDGAKYINQVPHATEDVIYFPALSPASLVHEKDQKCDMLQNDNYYTNVNDRKTE